MQKEISIIPLLNKKIVKSDLFKNFVALDQFEFYLWLFMNYLADIFDSKIVIFANKVKSKTWSYD